MTAKLAALLLPIAALVALPLPACAAPADDFREVLRIRIVNDHPGEVAVSDDAGATWQTLGRVLRYTEKTNPRGFTASMWVPPGRVAATAVNAIHITVGRRQEDDRGVIFSVLPREFLTPPAAYGSYLSPGSSIITDIPAGRGIFGGGEAPLVGSRVYLTDENASLSPLPEDYAPRRGDVLTIIVARPARYPIAAVFENRPGGAVTLQYADGVVEHLGWVIHPVGGIGRFAGSLYASTGRLRANHAGVVDISTSSIGAIGAFQIIPVGHALSPEMAAAWDRTQWMIVGPTEEDSLLWEGLLPLFWQHLRPDYRAEDLYAPDWRSRLLARFLVEVDAGDGWRPMPCLRLSADPNAPLPEWANRALASVVRLRILFPLAAP